MSGLREAVRPGIKAHILREGLHEPQSSAECAVQRNHPVWTAADAVSRVRLLGMEIDTDKIDACSGGAST